MKFGDKLAWAPLLCLLLAVLSGCGKKEEFGPMGGSLRSPQPAASPTSNPTTAAPAVTPPAGPSFGPPASTQPNPAPSSAGGDPAVVAFEGLAQQSRPPEGAKVNVLPREEYEMQSISDPSWHQKFQGQFIEISGTIGSFFLTSSTTRNICLGPDDNPSDFKIVPYNTLDREPWANVSIGQKVKLRGWWVENRGWVFEIVEKGAPTVVNTTAEELASEFAAGASAAQRKYAHKGFIVAGVLDQKIMGPTADGEALKAITLKTNGNTVVKFNIADTPKFLLNKLEVGQPVKVYGQSFVADEKEVMFTGAFLISPETKAP